MGIFIYISGLIFLNLQGLFSGLILTILLHFIIVKERDKEEEARHCSSLVKPIMRSVF